MITDHAMAPGGATFGDLAHRTSAPEELLAQVDSMRLQAGKTLSLHQKAALGQFFTPVSVARLVASMLECLGQQVHVLDAGAGVGSLFAATVAELCQRPRTPKRISVTAYELDPELAILARQTLSACEAVCEQAGITFLGEVIEGDFLECAVTLLRGNLFSSQPFRPAFTCAILNPPYHKIHSQSRHRKLLRQIGVETSNLYAGFLAAATLLLEPQGELVAITPRSFCNGVYFRGFRRSLLKAMSLRRIHVFESREDAFHEDDVLQENVIISAAKGVSRPTVTISSSAGPDDDMILSHEVGYDRVVRPGDPQSFIHIVPDELGHRVVERLTAFPCSLRDLGLTVSTGRVVDFRARDFLRRHPDTGTAPLIYPTHFASGYVAWPKPDSRKPNALAIAARTRPQVVPNEHYVLVRRFSSKEERKRVVAAVYDADRVPGTLVGFENHLNYFHRDGRGLDLTLARGLAVYLNSTLVDTYFRQFNGHTQVNAADLWSMKYPTAEQLIRLGSAVSATFPDQDTVDALVREELFEMAEAREVDPVQAKKRIDEALSILRALDYPRQQQNERSALTLLALLDIKPDTPWSQADSPLRGITPMMDFFREHYGKSYAPNTRETVRRQTVHQFLEAGLVAINPDDPGRPTNSGQTVYQIRDDALQLLQAFGTEQWDAKVRAYVDTFGTLKERYARERAMTRIPVTVAPGKTITLSPGGQSPLVKAIIQDFCALFTPGGMLLYVGDTGEKFPYFDTDNLAALGVAIEPHGKVPDLIVYHVAANRLVLIEAVTSHGPINQKRKDELERLFADASPTLIFVTAFADRKGMARYLSDIAWETEVWAADAPTHLIHFNGEKFLGSSREEE